MGKHFNLEIDDCSFNFSLNEESIASEKILDGIYILRSSLSAEEMEIEECVRQYKNLANDEKAFRTMKISDLKIRPIYHYLDQRIKMHIFLTMLSYYVEWHLNDVWRDLTFCDTEQDLKKYRDPVAPAKRSEKALKKIRTKMSSSTLKAESFGTVMENLATISKVTLRLTIPKTDKQIRYQKKPILTALQQKAYQLIEMIPQYP
jgi:transposase